jgi:hypothetical protein
MSLGFKCPVKLELVLKFTKLLRAKRMMTVALMSALGIATAAVMAQSNPDSNSPPPPPPDRPEQNDAPPPPPPPPPMRLKKTAEAIHGSVEGFNLTPRGTVAGVLIKTDAGLAQFNTPPDMGANLKQSVSVGDTVDAQGFPLQGRSDHPVYELSSIQGPKGQKLTIAAPWDVHLVHVEGKVKQLNYSREGRVDGAQLDNGDLVHLGPAAEQMPQLSSGQKLTVDGYGRPTPDGHQAIDAIQVNGTLITPPPPRGHREGPGDRTGRQGPPPGEDSNQPPPPPQQPQ